jgi:glycosyltransferase involved in cell wall biosynthesis
MATAPAALRLASPVLVDIPVALRRPVAKLAVVIPALNEAATVGSVIASVPRTIEGVGRVEVILVDDGSTDTTQQVALAAGADAIVRHTQRRGLVAAFKSGVAEAMRRGANVVVHLDADGQHDPALIPNLIEPILGYDADIVLGVRAFSAAGEDLSPARRYGNIAGTWVMRRVVGLDISDATTGYRAFTREALMRLNVVSDYTYTLETLIDAARKQLSVTEVPIEVRTRLAGESRMTYSIPRYIRRTGGQAFSALVRQHLVGILLRLAVVFLTLAAVASTWFVLGYHHDGVGRHLPALLAAMLSTTASIGFFVTGLLASAIDSSRRLLEDALYHVKCIELGVGYGGEGR